MSTAIISEESRHSWTVELLADSGQDIMPDVLASAPGVIYCAETGEAWVPTDDDAKWWAKWARREELINAAVDEAIRCGDDLEDYYAAIVCGGDWEAAQRRECAALGIEFDMEDIEHDMTPDEVVDEAMAN